MCTLCLGFSDNFAVLLSVDSYLIGAFGILFVECLMPRIHHYDWLCREMNVSVARAHSPKTRLEIIQRMKNCNKSEKSQKTSISRFLLLR